MGRTCPPELRCPGHLVIPFSATYYDLEDPNSASRRSGAAVQSPWVGNVDIERYHFELYSDLQASSCDNRLAPPHHPGYRIAPVGQLQILVKTPTQAVKVFLVPYDLRCLPVGGRVLVRERTYVQGRGTSSRATDTAVKETLRYALQLQLTCVSAPRYSESASNSRNSSTTRRKIRSKALLPSEAAATRCATPTPRLRAPSVATALSSKAFYVSRSLKVIFTSSPPEKDEILRVERTDEVVMPSEETGRSGGIHRLQVGSVPAEAGRREEEWEMIRLKYLARQEVDLRRRENREDAHDCREELSEDRGRSGSYERSSVQSSSTPFSHALRVLGASSVPIDALLPVAPTRADNSLPKEGFGLALERSKTSSASGASLVWTPATRRSQRGRLRRGSGGQEERELSDKLRGLEVGQAERSYEM
jgi:hypothetical protein